MKDEWLPIFLSSLFAMLLAMVEHWFPWSLLLLRPLSKYAVYVLGVLAIALPFTVLVILFPFWAGIIYLWAFWSITGGAGLGALLSAGIDAILMLRVRAIEAEAREAQLLKELK